MLQILRVQPHKQAINDIALVNIDGRTHLLTCGSDHRVCVFLMPVITKVHVLNFDNEVSRLAVSSGMLYASVYFGGIASVDLATMRTVHVAPMQDDITFLDIFLGASLRAG